MILDSLACAYFYLMPKYQFTYYCIKYEQHDGFYISYIYDLRSSIVLVFVDIGLNQRIEGR